MIDSFEKHATSVRAALLPRDSEDYRVGKIVASEQRFVNPYMCVDALVTDGEHLLVGRKASDPAGLWRLVGGFVDSHESLEEACRREVREETGLVVEHLTYVTSSPVADWRYAGGPENILSACYVATVTRKGHAQAGDDIDALAWCVIEGFDVARIHPSHAQFMRAGLVILEKAIHDAERAL